MRSFALDVHKDYSLVAELMGQEEIKTSRFPHTPSGVQSFLRKLDTDCQVVMEATGNAFWLHDQFAPVAGRVIIANPLQLKAISQARIKTDKVDASIMVRLLAAGFIPEVHVPSPETRHQKSLVNSRLRLRRMATQAKNRIHAALQRNHVRVQKPFTKEGRAKLAQAELPWDDRFDVEMDLRLLDHFEEEMARMEDVLAKQALEGPKSREVQLAMTVPGLDVVGASLLVLLIDDVSRFPTKKHLASYLGLVPSLHQSGKTERYGHITKRGSREARRVLNQAAWTVVRKYKETSLFAFFERIEKRRGTQIAITALSRKLTTLLWEVLTRGEPCRAGRAATIARKLVAARRRARKVLLSTEPASSAQSPVAAEAPMVVSGSLSETG